MPDPKKKPTVPTTDRYKNAKKVETLPSGEGWTEPVTIDNKTYTDKASKDAIPGSPGGMSQNELIIWKQGLIDRVRGGENPYTMYDKKYFSDPALLGELAKEYKAVYTEPTKPVTMPLSPAAGTRTAGLLQPKLTASQEWDTYRYLDPNGQTNKSVDRIFKLNPTTNIQEEYDPITDKFSGKKFTDYSAETTRSDAQGTTMLPNSLGNVPVIKDTSNVLINTPIKRGTVGSGTSGGFKHGGLIAKVKYANGGDVKLPTNNPEDAELMGNGQINPTYANQGLTSTGQKVTPEQQRKRAYGITGPQKSGDILGDALSAAGQGGNAGQQLGGTKGAAIGAGAGLIGSLAPTLIDAGTTDVYGRYDTGSKAGDYAAGIGSKGLGGAAKGAAAGAQFGGTGMLIGAGVGLVGGGIMGGIKANKDIKSIADEKWAKNHEKVKEKIAQQQADWQLKYDREMQERGFKGGGLVKKLGCYANGGDVNNVSLNPLNGLPRDQGGRPLYFSPSTQDPKKVNTQYDEYGETSETGFGGGGGGLKLSLPTASFKGGGLVKKFASGGVIPSANAFMYTDPNIIDGRNYDGSPMEQEKEIYGRGYEAFNMVGGGDGTGLKGTASFRDGGLIKGAGGPKSDSIKAKVEDGSFIVPAENKHEAMMIRKMVLKAPSVKKKANLNQAGGENIKVSDGEVLFDPMEKKMVEAHGIDLNVLAPNQDNDNAFDTGGEVAKKKAIQKAYVDYQTALNDNGFLLGPKEKQERIAQSKAAYDKAVNDYKSSAKVPTAKKMEASNDFIDTGDASGIYVNDKHNRKIYSTTGAKVNKVPSTVRNKTNANAVSKNGLTIAEMRKLSPSMGEPTGNVTPQYSDVNKQTTLEELDPYKVVVEPQTETGRGLTSQQALGLASQGRGLVSALTNQILPRKQVRMGLDFLNKAGARPVDKIDPAYIDAVNRAQSEAKFGYTPEEQALIDQRNQSALNAGRFAARNYSGGSSANAYNMERQAINESFGRGLQSVIANRKLQLSKQERADELVGQKQELNRRLFQDTMQGWNQNQQSGAQLVNTGLMNQIGAKRYADTLSALQENRAIEGSWLNNI